jgi:arginyl-tRNA synthetase
MINIKKSTELVICDLLMYNEQISKLLNNLKINKNILLAKYISVNVTREYPFNFQSSFLFKIFQLFKKEKLSMLGSISIKSPHQLGNYLISLYYEKFTNNEFAPYSFNKNNPIERIDLSKRGFFMIELNKKYLSDYLFSSFVTNNGIEKPQIISKNEEYSSGVYRTKIPKVLVDYSSPNIAKQLHVGHLRSTIIGDMLSNILEFGGCCVDRINHVGDWGTQFGMLIAHLKELYINEKSNNIDKINLLSIGQLSNLYKQSKKRFEVEPTFKDIAMKEVVLLQNHDVLSIKIWKLLYTVSENAFKNLYQELGINNELKTLGESFYNDKIDDVVAELSSKNLLLMVDGAICFKYNQQDKTGKDNKFKKMLVIKKKDGSMCYSSTDLTAIRYRLVDCGYDKIIYVVDSSQELHFRMIFEAAKIAGWITTNKTVIHRKFGLVQDENGKKIKSREGDTVNLSDLINEAKTQCFNRLKERIEEANNNLLETTDELDNRTDKEIQEISDALAISGLKYYDVSRELVKNYKFSYDKILDPRGDTAVYLQYAHARMKNIIKKSKVNIDSITFAFRLNLEEKEEIELAMELINTPCVFERIVNTLELLPLCEYMRNLCVKFSKFYSKCRVIGSDQILSRLQLTYITAEILKQCMTLLGMQVVDHI